MTTSPPILSGKTPVRIPLAMSSVGSQGSPVTTATDGIRFLHAFMNAELFSRASLDAMLTNWNRIFLPLRYGTGVMKFCLSPLMSLPGAPREFLGHSGSSGAVLFWAPAADLYICGTLNQMAKPSMPFRLLPRLAALASVPG